MLKPLVRLEWSKDIFLIDNKKHLLDVMRCPTCYRYICAWEHYGGNVHIPKKEKFCSVCGTRIDYSDYWDTI